MRSRSQRAAHTFIASWCDVLRMPARNARRAGKGKVSEVRRRHGSSVAIISGFPRKLEIFPVTHTAASLYFVSGAPNLARSEPPIRIVKASFGYGSSRFRNVGSPLLFEAKCVLATFPQPVRFLPTWSLASAAVILVVCAEVLNEIRRNRKHEVTTERGDFMRAGAVRAVKCIIRLDRRSIDAGHPDTRVSDTRPSLPQVVGIVCQMEHTLAGQLAQSDASGF